MFCYRCGKQLDDSSQFCESCGAVISKKTEPVPIKTNEPEKDKTSNNNSTKFKKLFIDENEEIVSFLGSSYAINYLSSEDISGSSCVLTDKRIYYKGKSYKKIGEHLIKNKEETIVDVKDITASGFIESTNTGLLIRSWILLILSCIAYIIVPFPSESKSFKVGDFSSAIIYIGEIALIFFTVISFVRYFLQKVKLFYIAFAGGILSFKATDYSYSDIRKFNILLRKVINNVK